MNLRKTLSGLFKLFANPVDEILEIKHDKDAFRTAAKEGDVERMKEMVKKYGSAAIVNSCGVGSENALHKAAQAGQLASVKYLLTLPEIDINAITKSRETALNKVKDGPASGEITALLEKNGARKNDQLFASADRLKS